jgi:hypothetical protein
MFSGLSRIGMMMLDPLTQYTGQLTLVPLSVEEQVLAHGMEGHSDAVRIQSFAGNRHYPARPVQPHEHNPTNGIYGEYSRPSFL